VIIQLFARLDLGRTAVAVPGLRPGNGHPRYLPA
jgi:hypothetical protein